MKHKQVLQSMSGTSPFTALSSPGPSCADNEEISELDNYGLSIPFIPKDLSAVDDTRRPTVASCPNKAKFTLHFLENAFGCVVMASVNLSYVHSAM